MAVEKRHEVSISGPRLTLDDLRELVAACEGMAGDAVAEPYRAVPAYGETGEPVWRITVRGDLEPVAPLGHPHWPPTGPGGLVCRSAHETVPLS